MTFAIDATPGSATANSFVTSAEMTSYCEARLNASVWTGAAAQLPALAEATRDISLMGFAGMRATSTQALDWPRIFAPNPDSPFYPDYFASTVVPQRVKDATCELALQYLKLGTTDLAAIPDTQYVIEKTVDVLTTRYAEPYQRPKGLARFPRVMEFLRPLLSYRSSLVTPVFRG